MSERPESLRVALANGVATLTLNRPDRGNALSEPLVEALHDALDASLADTSVHTILLRADGAHFCTGFDLGEVQSASDGDLLRRFVRVEQLLARVWEAPIRTAALAHGRCWGAGADLFVACERRIAASDAEFRFPGAGFGIVLGTRRLCARVGEATGRRLLTEGGRLDAQMALASGLAERLVDAAPTRQAFGDILEPPVVTRPTGAALRAASRAAERGAIDYDLAALVRSAAAPGLRERILRYRDAIRVAGKR